MVTVTKCREHGGRCPEGTIDFSSNLNPLGPPEWLLRLAHECLGSGALLKYPDYEYRALREAIAAFYGVEPSLVTPMNGAAEAIHVLPLILKVRTLVVLEPTFGDHSCLEEALGLTLKRLHYKEVGNRFIPPSPEEVARTLTGVAGPAAILASDPNNPTGSPLGYGWVEELASLTPPSTTLIIDAAFKEFSEPLALERFAGLEGVVIVASFTKTLAVPGLRAGFVFSPDSRIRSLVESARQAWNVNGLAECVIRRALTEHECRLREYLKLTRDVVRDEREYLVKALASLGLKVFESEAPYVLVKHEGVENPGLVKELLRRGYCVRDASSFHGLNKHYTRVAVRLRGEAEGLIKAFEEVLSHGLGPH